MAPSDEDQNTAAVADDQDGAETVAPLTIENLEAKIESPSTCKRHITVTISAEDVKKYFDRKYEDLVPLAQVPGFRAGKAPKELVHAERFRCFAEHVEHVELGSRCHNEHHASEDPGDRGRAQWRAESARYARSQARSSG